jgi:hypothetical protein
LKNSAVFLRVQTISKSFFSITFFPEGIFSELSLFTLQSESVALETYCTNAVMVLPFKNHLGGSLLTCLCVEQRF